MDFLKKFSSNKKICSCLGILVLVALFCPLAAHAFIPIPILSIMQGAAGGLGETTANGILGFIFGTLMSVPIFILQFSLDALTWVTSGDFLVIKFTNITPGTTGYNALVATGWGFTRNMANVVLIFGLVIIALSIIMGYQETRAKKTLVNFVLIAALINFTPVIAGLVIDLAQVVMNLLLKGGVAPSYTTTMLTKISGLSTADLPTLVILCVFCLFAAVTYLLFALLFLVRIVMLWILVILSPIAFATKVMPDEVQKITHHIFPSITNWDEWWKQFLQWCFVGIPASGAIWLSNVMMAQIAANPGNIFSSATGSTLTGALGPILDYLIPFIILINGLFISLDSGGWVGAKIRGYADKAGQIGKGAAIGGALGFASGAVAGAQSGSLRAVATGAFKGGAQGVLTQGKGEKEQINRWYTRNIKERLGLAPIGSATKDEQKEINELVAGYKNIPVADLQRIAQQAPNTVKNRREKTAAIIAAVDRGEDSAIRQEEVDWIAANRAELTRRGADLNKIADYAPEVSNRIIIDRTTGQTVEGMSTKKFQEGVRAESLNNFDVVTSATHSQIKKTLDDGSPAQVRNLRLWLSDPARSRQLRDEITRMRFLLNNYRSGGLPGVQMLTNEEAIEMERRLNNLSRSIINIRDSMRNRPSP